MGHTESATQSTVDRDELKKQRAAKSAASKRLWIRATLLIGAAVHVAFTRSWWITGYFGGAAVAYVAVLALVSSFPTFNKDEQSKLLGKRFMSLLSSGFLGTLALYSTVTGQAAELSVGVHLGTYFVDSWSMTDAQLAINALIFHHVSLYVSAVYLIILDEIAVLILISFQELSNPFWYGHMILKLHNRAPESTLFYSRFSVLFAYLFVRFAYGLPQYLTLQYTELFVHWTFDSLFHWFTIISFVGISANNIMKVCRS